ncbi:MAG: hypothetical protein LBB63_01280 [Holosporaceae bacterium]|nr:hypothetical protein [Holosporaceae bacterium]
MNKIATLLFVCFFAVPNYNSAAIDNYDDKRTAKSLQAVFEKVTPLNVTLVSRGITSASYGPLSLDEIALIFACLAVNLGADSTLVREKLTKLINEFRYDALLPNISEYLRVMSLQMLVAARTSLLGRFQEYCDRAAAQMCSIQEKDAWRIIVFNEMFFSKTPLLREEICKILELFFDFIAGENLLMHCNFLYTLSSKDPSLINASRTNLENKSNYMKMLVGQHEDIASGYSTFLLNKFWNVLNNSQQYNLLMNQSCVVYKEQYLTTYNKSSYCTEADNLIIGPNSKMISPNAYVYYFGNGLDAIGNAQQAPLLANVVLNNITSEICYDLELRTRYNNQWNNLQGVHTKSKLHIFTSNSYPVSGTNALPPDRTVIFVDPFGTDPTDPKIPHNLTSVLKNPTPYLKTRYYPYVKSHFSLGENHYSFVNVRDILR